MGPRLCRRGNRFLAVITNAGSGTASMGPRLCRRGNRDVEDQPRDWTRGLQWGHVFVDVEIDEGRP